MWNYIKRKIEKRKTKRTFQEYGSHLDQFQLPKEGRVEFAQWLHPFEKPKAIEQEQVDFYRRYVNTGDFAIDIGAHTGDTTVPMALAVGREGLVLGLEPNPYVFKILRKNSNLNRDKTNIIPLDFAVTEEDGSFTFNYSDASFCNGGFLSVIKNQRHNHNYSLEVKGKNFVKYLLAHYEELLPKLSLIKIDAEGYDKTIIRSIQTLIIKYKPYIITECYKRLTKEERHEFFDLVKGLNYKLYYLEDFNFKKEEIKSADDMMNWKHFDMILEPDRSHQQ